MIIEVFGKVSPPFSTKYSKDDKIVLNENDKPVSNDCELCQIFCDYFSNIFPGLQIPSLYENISNVIDISYPVLGAMNMFQDHPSTKNISAKILNQFFPSHTNKIET